MEVRVGSSVRIHAAEQLSEGSATVIMSSHLLWDVLTVVDREILLNLNHIIILSIKWSEEINASTTDSGSSSKRRAVKVNRISFTFRLKIFNRSRNPTNVQTVTLDIVAITVT